jgi:hypothetical protein
MISDWELWACANEMIGQHGEDAGIFAGLRADALESEGDEGGAKIWRLIVLRINQLQAEPSGTIQ